MKTLQSNNNHNNFKLKVLTHKEIISNRPKSAPYMFPLKTTIMTLYECKQLCNKDKELTNDVLSIVEHSKFSILKEGRYYNVIITEVQY